MTIILIIKFCITWGWGYCFHNYKKRKITNQELREIIKEQFGMEAWKIKNESKENMKAILRKGLKIEGVSARQLSRVTGISVNIIWKL